MKLIEQVYPHQEITIKLNTEEALALRKHFDSHEVVINDGNVPNRIHNFLWERLPDE